MKFHKWQLKLAVFAATLVLLLVFNLNARPPATVSQSRYDAWRKYRVLLTRVDTSLAPDINWPDPPED